MESRYPFSLVGPYISEFTDFLLFFFLKKFVVPEQQGVQKPSAATTDDKPENATNKEISANTAGAANTSGTKDVRGFARALLDFESPKASQNSFFAKQVLCNSSQLWSSHIHNFSFTDWMGS